MFESCTGSSRTEKPGTNICTGGGSFTATSGTSPGGSVVFSPLYFATRKRSVFARSSSLSARP